MKKLMYMTVMLLMAGACGVETVENPDKVVNIKRVHGTYKALYEPISREEFLEKFRPGWYCSSLHDVFPDGSIGENYILIYDMPIGGTVMPDPFSVYLDDTLKIYSYFEDFSGDYYECRLRSYSYDDEGNKLSFEGYYSICEPMPEGIVISLTDTTLDFLTPVQKQVPLYGQTGTDQSSAVFTLCRFKKLSETRIAQLDSLHTEWY